MTAAATPLWRRQPERGSPFMMRLIVRIALRCGRRCAGALLPLICLYFIVFSHAARRASRAYLARVLQHEPRAVDVYRHYLCFATTILDRVFWMSGRLDSYDVAVVGAEHVHDAFAEGRGCLLFGAHFGSFELTRVLARGIPGVQVDVLMHAANARKLAAVLADVDPTLALDIIPLGERDTMLRVRDALRAGHGVGLLADRSLDAADSVPRNFLGAPAVFPRSPFKLAVMLGAPVVLFQSTWLGGRRYRIEFVRLPMLATANARADAGTAIDDYVAWLEAACRAAPYNWFNFYDFWTPVAHA